MSKDQIRKRRWYLSHQELTLSRAAAWAAAHPDRAAAAKVKWRTTHPAEARAAGDNWQRNNPERYAANNRRWRENNPQAVQSAQQRQDALKVVELRDCYLRAQLARELIPVTPENIKTKRTQIQICRTKRLLSTMATAAVLTP